jgi:hypothetical protein
VSKPFVFTSRNFPNGVIGLDVKYLSSLSGTKKMQ